MTKKPTPHPPKNFRPRHPYGFEHFDPLRGEVPAFNLRNELRSIARRARLILSPRTREEILFAASSINWMLDQVRPLEMERFMEHFMAMDLADTSDPAPASPDHEFNESFENDSTVLLRHHATFDIVGQKRLPNATWADYFAVLSLAHINEACEELHHRRFELNVDLDEEDAQRAMVTFFIALYALSAMEAVCIAESFSRQAAHVERTLDEYKATQREKIRLQKRAAAIIRHADRNRLYRELYEFWKQRDVAGVAGNTYRNAARLFVRAVKKADEKSGQNRLATLRDDNLVETLSTALSKYIRGERTFPLPDS